MEVMEKRALSTIAREVRKDWGERVYFGAKPYLEAMEDLTTMDDRFFQDDARSIVRYFLANASGWRGETARRVKAELKAMLK